MTKTIKQILKIISDNKLFDQKVELIGGWCLIMYQRHLGAEKYPFVTQDIDFLIPNPYRGQEKISLANEFEKIGFRCSFNSDGSIFLWSSELKIEFITPEKGRGSDKPITIKNLGINAIPLRFANLLLQDPITVKEGNTEVLLPNPSCFFLHKLIVSTRRKTDKALKDLEHAIYTFSICDKDYLIKTYNELPTRWRKRIHASVENAKKNLFLHKEAIGEISATLQG